MQNSSTLTIYELTVNALVSWQAHSLSNEGTDGSNKVMPRSQMLADGSVTDACSGSIAKHHHAVLLAEYLAASAVPLCPACLQLDGRRAAALIERPEYKNISVQLTRRGDSKEEGQMLMKKPTRSGDYALEVRYRSVGIGVDTDKWQVAIVDEQQRLLRHRAILSTLRDTLLSPDGAMTATMLPHLTGLQGAIVLRNDVGRAPMYSALKEDFVTRLVAMGSDTRSIYPFETVDAFNKIMEELITISTPCLPATYRAQQLLREGL